MEGGVVTTFRVATFFPRASAFTAPTAGSFPFGKGEEKAILCAFEWAQAGYLSIRSVPFYVKFVGVKRHRHDPASRICDFRNSGLKTLTEAGE
jgi:hypothetical protein